MSYGDLVYSNPKIVNYNNENLALYTSKQIPNSIRTLPEPVNNIAAANSYIKGGSRIKKNNNRIYNMLTKYKRHKIKSAKNSYYLTKKRLNKNKKGGKYSIKNKRKSNKKRKLYKGGYGQYMNNTPNTPSYSLGGLQSSNFPSALANPPIQTLLSNCTNCVDNYNHYTNMGFPSKNI